MYGAKSSVWNWAQSGTSKPQSDPRKVVKMVAYKPRAASLLLFFLVYLYISPRDAGKYAILLVLLSRVIRSCHIPNDFLLCVGARHCCTPTCSQIGSVRLVDGSNSYEGRVEACYGNSWGSAFWGRVCDSSWSINDARVICRQLGYPSSGEKPFL